MALVTSTYFYHHCPYVLKMSSDLLFIVFFFTGTLFLGIVFLLTIDQRKELKYYPIMNACQVIMR